MSRQIAERILSELDTSGESSLDVSSISQRMLTRVLDRLRLDIDDEVLIGDPDNIYDLADVSTNQLIDLGEVRIQLDSSEPEVRNISDILAEIDGQEVDTPTTYDLSGFTDLRDVIEQIVQHLLTVWESNSDMKPFIGFQVDSTDGVNRRDFPIKSHTIDYILNDINRLATGVQIDEQIESARSAIVSQNIWRDKQIVISIYRDTNSRIQNYTSGFCRYTNQSPLDLSDIQCYQEFKPEQVCCIVYTIETAWHKGYISREVADLAIQYVPAEWSTRKHLKDMAECLGIFIKLFIINKGGTVKHCTYGDKNSDQYIPVAELDGHFFLNHQITKSVLVKQMPVLNMLKANKWGNITYFNLYRFLKREGYLTRIEATSETYQAPYFKQLLESTNLEYDNSDVQLFKPKEEKKDFKPNEYFVIDADFESITDSSGKHIPDELYVLTENGESEMFEDTDLVGDLVTRGLDWICGQIDRARRLHKNSERDTVFKPLIYFHNLKYDANFIIKYLSGGKAGVIETLVAGGKRIFLSGLYKPTGSKFARRLVFRCNYAIIPTALSEFGKMFALDVEKNICPHGLYTRETIKLDSVPVTEALRHLPEPLVDTYKIGKKRQSIQSQFLKQAQPFIDGYQFRHMDFRRHYCKLDVEVQQLGRQKFAQGLMEDFGVNVYDIFTVSGIAIKVLEKRGCFDGCCKVSGIPRRFLEKGVVGGRCMTANNKKCIYINNKITVLDAVSLYPSAMSKNGFMRGEPKPFKGKSYQWLLENTDKFFARVKNVKINKRQTFPVLSQLSDTGSRDFLNQISDGNVYPNIVLEDAVNFQDATFDIVDGYYFDDGSNDTICEVVMDLFKKRAQLKAEGNPKQTIYKLVLNSLYGKLIEKAHIEQKRIFTNFDSLREHLTKQKFNSRMVDTYNGFWELTLERSFGSFSNFAHLGGDVLGMSKHIMNKVTSLADRQNIPMYYTDTDSIHLYGEDDAKLLAQKYREEYGEELIGLGLGQFHSDFDLKAGYGVEAIYLDKKMYAERVENSEGERQTEIGAKGISAGAIADQVHRNFGGDTFSLFKAMSTELVDFQLDADKPCINTNNFSNNTLKKGSFTRTIGGFGLTESERNLKLESDKILY